jgi:hypothetical protein
VCVPEVRLDKKKVLILKRGQTGLDYPAGSQRIALWRHSPENQMPSQNQGQSIKQALDTEVPSLLKFTTSLEDGNSGKIVIVYPGVSVLVHCSLPLILNVRHKEYFLTGPMCLFSILPLEV